MTSSSAQSKRESGVLVRRARTVAPNQPQVNRLLDFLDSDERQPAASKRRERRYRRLLALGDVLAGLLALVIAGPLVGDTLQPLAFITPMMVVLAAKVVGLYDQDELRLKKSTLDEVPSLFNVALLTAFSFWLVHPALIDQQVGRDQVVGLWLALFGMLVLMRLSSRRLARQVTTPERCLVVGAPASSQAVARKIETSTSISAECVVSLEIEAIVDLPGRVSDALAAVAEHHKAERVVIAARDVDQEGVLDVVRAAKLHGLKVTMVPRMVEAVGSSIVFDDVDGTLMLGVRRFGLSRSSRLLKRAFDVVGSSIGLLILAPTVGLIALAIKLDTRGGVLFRQSRIGRHGETFRIHKFRTMVSNAAELKEALREQNEAVGLFKIADDPRVTRVGRFLRRTSLDELPQLWDVLCGRMSLVGPRPLIAEETERIGGWHRRRMELTPGMTGPWQVLGGARLPLDEMTQLDYLYAANWSLWLDVKILLRTVPHVLQRRSL
jgi:exopolysaccharide biosynthesis polyprenyl glycosylphosphotransferase